MLKLSHIVSKLHYITTKNMHKRNKPCSKQGADKSEEPCSPIYHTKSKKILIQILVKPNSSYNSISDINENHVVINIAAPPVDGACNGELIKYLASVLDIKKSSLSIAKGLKSKEKVISLNDEQYEIRNILSRFKKELK